MIEPAASGVDCFNVDNALLTIPERARAGTVEQTQLLIGPNGIDHIRLAWNADASTSTESFPIASTVNIQFGEDLIDCADEVSLLFESVPGCNSDTEAFLAAGDSWIINSLNVNVMFCKKFVGRCFCKCCITNKNWYNMGGTGAMRTFISSCVASINMGGHTRRECQVPRNAS